MDGPVLAQLSRLDGRLDAVDGGWDRALLSLRFPRPLLRRPVPVPWDPTGLDVFDHLLAARPDLLDADGALRLDAFLDVVFGEEPPGLATSLVAVEPRDFTPFEPGSADFGELDGLVEEAALREVFDAPKGGLAFVLLGFTEGFPNHYFVRRGDPEPGDPSVWSTDHEVFFTEVKREGTLAEFLSRFATRPELAEQLRATSRPWV